MFKCNRIPKIALLVLLLAFAYLAVLILLGQERAMDWGLSSEEMYLHEKLLSLAAAAGGIATWLLGMYRAHLQGSWRSEEHTSELQSLMRISYAVFCLKKKKT